MDELKATAQLPNLTVELTRCETADGEQIVIELTARPTFAAVETLLNASLVWFWPWMALNPFVRAWSGRLDRPGDAGASRKAAPRLPRLPRLHLVRPPDEK